METVKSYMLDEYGSQTFSRMQLKILDMVMPVLSRIDRFWPWKGLSVIGVALKETENRSI